MVSSSSTPSRRLFTVNKEEAPPFGQHLAAQARRREIHLHPGP